MSNQTWMADSTGFHSKQLRYICLPVTHDSGTWPLTDQMTPDQNAIVRGIYDELQKIVNEINDIPGIGTYIPDPAELVYDSATASAKGLATATSRTIAQQLNDGIRGLDLRIYYNPSDSQFYTFHGFVGTAMTSVLLQIQQFLTATSGEIVYITCGHYSTEEGTTFPQSTFESLLLSYLQNWLYVPAYENGQITNDPFTTTYTDIIGQEGVNKSRAILVVQEAPDDSPYFWPSSYSPPDGSASNTTIYGFYTYTTDPQEAISTQQSQFRTAIAKNLPFALYMTLTPSTADYAKVILSNLSGQISVIAAALLLVPLTAPIGIALEAIAAGLAIYGWTRKWDTLLELSQLLDADLSYVVVNDFALPEKTDPYTNLISMIYLDWYETTNVVNLAIDLSNGQLFSWQGNEPVTISGTPTNTNADHSPAIAALGDTLYMVYPYNTTLYWASSSDPTGESWSGGTAISAPNGTPGTSWNATAASFFEKMYVAFLGGGSQGTTVYLMIFDGLGWSGNTPMSAGGVTVTSSNTPSLCVYDDVLYMAFRGVGTDYRIYLTSLDPDSGTWSAAAPIPTISGQNTPPLTDATPTLAVYDGLLWVLYLGWNSQTIYYSTFDGNEWAGNNLIATSSNGDPETNFGPSAIGFDGLLWIIYKGQGDDDLMATTYNGTSWTGNQDFSSFTDISPKSDYNPGLAVYQDGLVMIYKGKGGSNTIYAAADIGS